MGTTFEVRVWWREDQQQLAPIAALWSELQRCEEALSDYLSASEARRLVDRRSWTPVGEVLAEALQWGGRLHEASGGVVDPTVGPLTRLWRRAARQGTLPPQDRLETAREAVGWHLLEQRPGPEARATREGMRLDFGAFGKGLALDRMGRLLVEAGLPHFMLDGGGDLLLGLAPPGAPGWPVRIEGRPGDSASLLLAECAVATSGLAARPLVIDEVQIGHILDARSGTWLDQDAAATVVAPCAAQADGWATALCVLGTSGLALLPAEASARIVHDGADGASVSVTGVFEGEAPAR